MLGRALVEQASVAENADLVGHPLHVVKDVAGEDDGAPAAQPGDQVQDVGAASRVECRRGFVEQQELRVTDQGAGQAEPLGHTARETADPSVGRVGEAGCAECAVHFRATGVSTDQGAGQVDDFVCGEPAVEVGDVRTDGDPLSRNGDRDSSGVGATHPGQDGQQRGLASAVGSHEAVHAPGGTRTSTSNRPAPP